MAAFFSILFPTVLTAAPEMEVIPSRTSIQKGSSFEISIKDLAYMIAQQVGFEGEILWDTSKPDGQPRRALDITQAEKLFGFRAKTKFSEGLRTMIDAYLAIQP